MTYVHNDFQKGIFGQGDYNEDVVALSLGLSYRIMSNVDVNAAYYFTTIGSDGMNPTRLACRSRPAAWTA